MDLLFFKIALALYLGASIAYLLFLMLSSSNRAVVALGLAVAGFSSHTLSILHRGIFSGFIPLAKPFDVLSFFAWLVIVIFLIVRYRDPSPFFGAIATPLASVLLLVATTLSHQVPEPLVPILRSWWLPVHVTLAVAGSGIFAFTAIAGSMYIIQEKLIKQKRIGRFHRLLPSLQTLDTINRHGLTVGFFLLTLGLISGALWANSVWGFYWSWDPKETWSLITWFAYAAMAHLRLVLGWRGRKAAILAILGFGLVLFSFLGVSILIGGHHAFNANPRFMGPLLK